MTVQRAGQEAALYTAKPAAGAIAERTLAEYLSDRLRVETVARPDGNGWEIAGISQALRDQVSSRRRAIGPELQQLVGEYEHRHGKAPSAVPEAYRRADGLSLWRRHGAEIYTTRAMLDTETRLLRAAAQTGAPRVAPKRAAAVLGADRARVEARLWREHGQPGAASAANSRAAVAGAPGDAADERTGAEPSLSSAGLTDDQAQAAYGVLTSGRAIDILVGPAGTGKTRTVAKLAEIWRNAGVGRVVGLTTSTNAAHALAAEGLTESYNLASFLGRIRHSRQTLGHLPVRPGDLLVVDETSMVSTADLAAVENIATRFGAKILLTGDTEQLSAPQAGGVMRLLADEHGYYQLHTVQRFEAEWERAGGVAALRAGSGAGNADTSASGRRAFRA